MNVAAGPEGGTPRGERIREFIASRRTLQLATVNDDGAPLASYAPFCLVDGALHVFLSRLAAHTGNLLERPIASVLLIEDETDADDPFALRRVTLRCRVETVERDSTTFDAVLDQMQKRHGETVATLRTLADFILFRLAPESGDYVEGFARAYRITGFDTFDTTHRRPVS